MKLIECSVSDYIEELASSKPTPGGGSAVSLVLCLGLALLIKSLKFSKKNLEKNYYSKKEKKINKILKQALDLIDLDKDAYDSYAKALSLPKDTQELKEKRRKKIQSSLIKATSVPLKSLELVKEGLSWCNDFKSQCKDNILSDFKAGVSFLGASYLGGMEFIIDNLRYVKDRNFILRTNDKIMLLTQEITDLIKEVSNVSKIVRGENNC